MTRPSSWFVPRADHRRVSRRRSRIPAADLRRRRRDQLRHDHAGVPSRRDARVAPRGTGAHDGTGGKGRNQAVALATLGEAVALIGSVGHDGAGGVALLDLSVAGVDTAFVRVRGDVTGRYVRLIGEDGPHQAAWLHGANELVDVEAVDHAAAVIEAAPYLVCQTGVPPGVIAAAIARAAGRVVLDAGPDPAGARPLVEHAWLVRANSSEAEALTGITARSEAGARAAASTLLSRGPTWVWLSAGPAGHLLASRDEDHWIPAPTTDVVDTTGAGDALLATVVVHLARAAPCATAAQHGVDAAGAVMARLGAGPFREGPSP